MVRILTQAILYRTVPTGFSTVTSITPANTGAMVIGIMQLLVVPVQVQVKHYTLIGLQLINMLPHHHRYLPLS